MPESAEEAQIRTPSPTNDDQETNRSEEANDANEEQENLSNGQETGENVENENENGETNDQNQDERRGSKGSVASHKSSKSETGDNQSMSNGHINGEDGDEANEESPRQNGSINGSKASIRSGSSGRASKSPSIPMRERLKVSLLDGLEKQHQCPMCNEVLRYPVKFNECGHHVCSACFHEYLRVEPRCPQDQTQISRDKATLDNALNNEIMALEARCMSHEWGCKWEGKVGEVQMHTEQCEFTDVLCINDCGAKFQRRFLQKHLDKDCGKKIIPCAFCDERYLREDKKNHLEDCPKVPLPCPNKCDKKLTIPRDELDQHIEQECPRTKIMCQFEEIGCPHRCSREKLPKHYKTGIIEHVRLLYDLIMKHSQRMDQHHELLQDHGALIETHQAQITDIEKIARNQLIWRIDEYSRKMKEAKAGNTTTLFSPPFTTSKHGYRLCASLCLNGDGKGKGTHVSAFISILKGAYDPLLKWPFSYRVTFYLLDQNADPSSRKHLKLSIKPNPCPDNEPFLGMPKLEKNASFGGAKFAKHEEVESRTYVKDDTIYVKITVDCDGSVEP